MRAIRILQANWLNPDVAGDRNTVKLVTDDMARDAVEVHQIAEYAPEYDPAPSFVGPERAAERLEELKATVAEYPATAAPAEQTGTDLAEMKLPDERKPELKQPYSIASKAEWINWAVHGDHGQDPITEEEAAKLTKIQLMGTYGGRL